ncbi:MAG: FeoB-associated Cys-rich membrane protein [Bacteroidota bacterium]
MNLQDIIVLIIVVTASLYLINKLRKKSKGSTCSACNKK